MTSEDKILVVVNIDHESQLETYVNSSESFLFLESGNVESVL